MSKWEIGTKLVHDEKGPSEYGAIGAAHGQAYWEAMGWRAVVPAPPVERALADGWKRYTPMPDYERCIWDDSPATVIKDGNGARMCDDCGAARGAFASPEPKAEAGGKYCDARCGTRGRLTDDMGDWWTLPTGERFCTHAHRERALKIRRMDAGAPSPKPAPVVENPRPPRCTRAFCPGGSQLLAMRRLGKGDPELTCEPCMMAWEEYTAKMMALTSNPKPHPAAHPGVTPVVFGLSVGILGARGMR